MASGKISEKKSRAGGKRRRTGAHCFHYWRRERVANTRKLRLGKSAYGDRAVPQLNAVILASSADKDM